MNAQQPADWVKVHPKVAVTMFAGACSSVLIAVCKKNGVDLAGQEENLMVIVSAIAGYLMPSE